MSGWKHQPVCVECGDGWPCFEERHAKELAAFNRQLNSMCHKCGEAIEFGQGSVLFGGPSPDNLKIEDVRFHANRSEFPECYRAAQEYEPRWRREFQAESRGGRDDPLG
jgi:hypothetical protein